MKGDRGVTAFLLSAFGDEVSQDLTEQLDVLSGAGLEWIEVRGAWGKNVLEWEEMDFGAMS